MLLANGHPDARRYPIGMLWDEARIITDRQNAYLASEISLIQLAVSSIMSKQSGTDLQKALKILRKA